MCVLGGIVVGCIGGGDLLLVRSVRFFFFYNLLNCARCDSMFDQFDFVVPLLRCGNCSYIRFFS